MALRAHASCSAVGGGGSKAPTTALASITVTGYCGIGRSGSASAMPGWAAERVGDDERVGRGERRGERRGDDEAVVVALVGEQALDLPGGAGPHRVECGTQGQLAGVAAVRRADEQAHGCGERHRSLPSGSSRSAPRAERMLSPLIRVAARPGGSSGGSRHGPGDRRCSAAVGSRVVELDHADQHRHARHPRHRRARSTGLGATGGRCVRGADAQHRSGGCAVPGGRPRPSAQRRRALAGGDAAQLVERVVAAEPVAGASLRHVRTMASAAASHEVYQQQVRGHDVVGGRVALHTGASGPFAVSGHPLGDLAARDPGPVPKAATRRVRDHIRKHWSVVDGARARRHRGGAAVERLGAVGLVRQGAAGRPAGRRAHVPGRRRPGAAARLPVVGERPVRGGGRPRRQPGAQRRPDPRAASATSGRTLPTGCPVPGSR